IGDMDVARGPELRRHRLATMRAIPFPKIAVDNRLHADARPVHHRVDAILCGPSRRFGTRDAVPERRVRPLQRLGEAELQHLERLREALARLEMANAEAADS